MLKALSVVGLGKTYTGVFKEIATPIKTQTGEKIRNASLEFFGKITIMSSGTRVESTPTG